MSAHTKEPFKREPRYVVFKIKDCVDYLSGGQIEFIEHIGDEIANGRRDDDRPPFNAVVVEQDWPEFDLVWSMIEARMTGKGNDARRIVACVNACAGISQQYLEELNGGTLADRQTVLMTQRDEYSLLAYRRQNILEEVVKQRDRLLAACKAALNHCDRETTYMLEATIASVEADQFRDATKMVAVTESEGGEA